MRTIKGAVRNKAKQRLFKKVKGYRGGRGGLFRTAKETLVRAGVYAFRDRRVRKREFRKLWIIRINAAVPRARVCATASSFTAWKRPTWAWTASRCRKWRSTIRPDSMPSWPGSKQALAA